MKKLMIAASALTLLTFAACKKDAQKQGEQNVRAGVLPNGSTIPGIISGNVELIENGTYYLDGKSYVTPGGEIVINKGATIKGISKSTPAEASALIVTRGGLIHAVGTVEQPIVFTSNNGTPAVGDWGGVVILGSAPCNKVGASIEGIDLPSLPPGVDVQYGGSNATDSSGILKYVRIEWAGANVSDNNELNSLTLGGVGSHTTLDYIQVSYGRDDAFEFFGGTVNASHLVSLNTNDDILDTDHGFTGTLSYVLAIRRPGFIYADANGIESDNDANSSSDTPRTRPTIEYATFIAGQNSAFLGTLNAARFRRNTGFNVTNSIFMGYNNGTTETEGASGVFTGNVVHVFLTLGAINPLTNETYIHATDANADIQLVDPFSLLPNFDPSTTTVGSGKGCNPAFDYWFLTWTAGL
ncbi:hypothetical protein GFS24_13495 [Chitinophaga sp. SYP-B3965]|uniref:hypothetical protein n=1 Tax=Chitinophaga sp. SYP-B3965 TaxID=2663120 RepID=UPI00129985E2|nr:hypothetical protein [Chitinophaga sp. SYP-B3965]MRG46137.1 hypothetical protein [Chitinophaga sp. SYP-B3965]